MSLLFGDVIQTGEMFAFHIFLRIFMKIHYWVSRREEKSNFLKEPF